MTQQKIEKTETCTVALLEVQDKFQVIKIQNEAVSVITTTPRIGEAEIIFKSTIECIKEFES
jgi:hypothetical protein